jgi:hypothetical protein
MVIRCVFLPNARNMLGKSKNSCINKKQSWWGLKASLLLYLLSGRACVLYYISKLLQLVLYYIYKVVSWFFTISTKFSWLWTWYLFDVDLKLELVF